VLNGKNRKNRIKNLWRMKMKNRFEILITQNGFLRKGITVIEDFPDGSAAVLGPDGTWKRYTTAEEQCQEFKPTFVLKVQDCEDFLKAMSEAYTHQSDERVESNIRIQGKHLEDMRKIAFNFLKIEI
jgi:hypothetical protein